MTQKFKYATNVDSGLRATYNEPEIRDALQLGIIPKRRTDALKKLAKRYLQASSYDEKRNLEKDLREFWKEQGEQYLRADGKGHGPEYICKEILDYCA